MNDIFQCPKCLKYFRAEDYKELEKTSIDIGCDCGVFFTVTPKFAWSYAVKLAEDDNG